MVVPQTVRFHAFPVMDRPLRVVSGQIPDRILSGRIYTAYPLAYAEYMGTVYGQTPQQVAEVLRGVGYGYNGLSAAKRHPDDPRNIDRGSYRRVPEAHPDLREYPWGDPSVLTDNWEPIECQFHVHLFRWCDDTEVYCHYEIRPDIFRPSFSIKRKKAHKWPTWHETYLLGVEDPHLDGLFD